MQNVIQLCQRLGIMGLRFRDERPILVQGRLSGLRINEGALINVTGFLKWVLLRGSIGA